MISVRCRPGIGPDRTGSGEDEALNEFSVGSDRFENELFRDGVMTERVRERSGRLECCTVVD